MALNMPELKLAYERTTDLYDARAIVRDRQDFVPRGSEEWQALARVANYLDAQYDHWREQFIYQRHGL